MKPGSNRRPRSRPNNNNNNKRQGGRNSYDSNGPDGKVRGTAQQVLEKYQALGRDATSAGDRIGAEAYFQYAEHYYRLVSADAAQQPQRPERQPENQTNQDTDSQGNVAPEQTTPEQSVSEQTVAEPALESQQVSEVVTVPIMPGPIEAPIAEEAEAQPDLLDGSVATKQEPEALAEEKPKPVRRRRPRAKVEGREKPATEPAQA